MENWQQRVIDEKAELEVKVDALKSFIENKKVFHALTFKPMWLLLMQYWHMNKYLNVLNKRIKLFN